MDEFAFELRDDRGRCRVEVHDDTRTCYAYLYCDDEIVGDVWIYNVGDPPDDWPWAHPGASADDAPFENPKELVDLSLTRPEIDPEGGNLGSLWTWSNSDLEYVDVTVDGVTWARLAPGRKPGWSRLARAEGPCALPLPDAS